MWREGDSQHWGDCLGDASGVFCCSGRQRSALGIPLGSGFRELARGLSVPWPAPLARDLCGVGVKDCTAYALDHWCCADPLDSSIVHIYLDGTGGAENLPAAWAFVCLSVRGTEGEVSDPPFHLIGYACGRVVCDPGCPEYVGVDAADSNAAEVSARIWASLWAMQAGFREVVFAYDSCFAAGVTKALYDTSVHRGAASVSAALWHTLTEVCEASDFHVHSHQGHPWNELADALATHASKGHAHNPCDDRVQRLMADAGAIPWAFLEHASSLTRQQYPGYSAVVCAPTAALPPEAIASRIDQHVSLPAPVDEVEAEELLVCTYNVMSLKAKCKQVQLAEALARRGCHVAGLQEGRSRKAGVWSSDGFWKIVASAERGNYGCQIWLSETLPFARRRGRPVRLCRDHITVEHSEPRRLVVTVRAPGVHVQCVSLHAPHSMDAGEAELWWRGTAEIVKACARVSDKLVFVDANAAVPTGVGQVTGQHAAGSAVALQSGVAFVEFARAHDLYLPCTYDEYVGDRALQCTYTPVGADTPTCRSDYVAVSRSFSVKGHSAIAWQDVDLGHKRDDHYPAVVVARPVPRMPDAPARRRKPCYDRGAVGEPSRDEIFAREIERLPAVPFEVEPTTHCHLLTEWMRHALIVAYGRPKAPARKPFITEATRELILQKNRAARCLRRAGAALGRAPVFVVFKVWAGHWGAVKFSHVTGFASIAQCARMVACRRARDALKEKVNATVHLEHIAYVDAAADRADAALASGNPVAVYAAVKSLLPRSAKPSVRVKTSTGQPTRSYAEERERFREHFAAVLEGTVMPLAEMIAAERADDSPSARCCKLGEARLGTIPTMAALVREFAHAKIGKAVGEDGVGGEAFRSAPWAMARLWHPLYVKSALTLRPPLQFRGGMVVELLKASGGGSECSHYRDVTVADQSAKTFSRLFRPELHVATARGMSAGQFGAGFNGGSTDVAHLALLAFLDAASSAKKCAAVLFVDLATAFASLKRRLCVPTDAGDESWLAALAAAGFAPADVKRIYDEAACGAYWERNGLSEHTLQVVAALHDRTWFTTEGLPNVVATSRGSQAGMSLADVMFIAAAGRIAAKIEEGLAEAGVTAKLPCGDGAYDLGGADPADEFDVPHVYYMDDGAVPVVSEAGELANDVARAAGVVADVYFTYGFELRAGPNKTAALVQWRGEGAITEQRKMQSGTGAGLQCRPERAPPFVLPVVHVYKHLGTKTAVGSGLGPEVAFKAAMVAEDLRRLRVRVLANPSVPTRDRARIGQALVFSRLLFQVGSWPRLTGSLARRFHSAVMRVYRAVAGATHESGLTDADVVGQLAVAPPLVLLRLARVTLAVRVASKAPAAMQTLLCLARPCARSWLRAVSDDLVWFSRVGGADRRLGAKTLPQWWAAFREEPLAFRKAFLAVARSDGARRTEVWAVTSAERELVERHVCEECERAFATKQALAVHRFKVHEGHAPARWHVSTTHCPVCLLEFHTRDRVVAHFDKSAVCKCNLLLGHPRLSEEEFAELQTHAAEQVRTLRAGGRSRCFAVLPCVRLQGPLPKAVAPVADPKGHPLGQGRRWHS